MIYIFLLLFSFNVNAKVFLVQCNDDPSKPCRIEADGFAPKKVICEVSGEEEGDVYSVNIVEIPDDFLGSLLDLVGLETSRPWSPSEVVGDNEKIVCTIDADKKQAKEDAKAAAEAAQAAREQAKLQRRENAKTLCMAQPDPSPLKALCEVVLGEDL